ncbi:RNA polymerase sigma factor [Flindersiella endophytica]
MPATTQPSAEPTLGDAEVIERSWDEPEAFSAVFDRHAAEIHRYVTRRLGHSAADDVVGETFLAAFRRRRKYDLGRGDARPWLYGIASNLIGRHRRAEVRTYRALARTGSDPVVASLISEDSGIERAESRVAAAAVERQLAAALVGLSRGDRDVLLLYAWADLAYDEIAGALGIPLGTVRSRLHRARRKVREALGGTNPLTEEEEPSNG